MTANKRILIGIFLLILVTLIGLDAVYWLLFFLWRCAADPSNNALWWPRVLIWFAVSTIAFAGWIILLVWILRRRKK
jgi:uncharacterized membrane-anchored protein